MMQDQPTLHYQQQQPQQSHQLHQQSQNLVRRASTTSTSMRGLPPSIRCSRSSTTLPLADVLPDGALIGVGHAIQGEQMQLVSIPIPAADQPAETLQVQGKLGTGSYAVVYLVREVLQEPSKSFLNYNDDSEGSCPASPVVPTTVLGRTFAVKCLSKSALDAEGLEAQMQEATIQQSLPIHPNIVTLYRTLETPSYLLLVMEHVPGSDLFYFLEQARDHEDLMLPSAANLNGTPPSPSLLASLHPSQVLSPRRLRLIASMFSQMCDAVAHCHLNGVAHRDVKPENFMVTESEVDGERRVVVKLTDFGLATRDVESGDMDCGSAPYMSFECHNNLTPTYATTPADVWSLGIVLINMLYHANPWLTTAPSECSSFDFFLREPVAFFMDRFPGMTHAVASYFGQHVFCLLDPAHHPYSPSLPSQRVTAAEFGHWTKDQLPTLLGPEARREPRPRSPRPRSPQAPSYPQHMSISQPPLRSRTPSPVQSPVQEEPEVDARSASGNSNSKRRKRAPRGNGHGSRGKTISSLGGSVSIDGEDRLSHLADATQRTAREASSLRGSKPPSLKSPSPVMTSITISSTSAGPQLRTKKSAKWADIFTRRDSGSDQDVPDTGIEPTLQRSGANKSTPNLTPRKSTPNLRSAPTPHANNVATLVRSLDPVPVRSPSPPPMDLVLADAFNPLARLPSPSSSSRGRKKDKGVTRDSPLIQEKKKNRSRDRMGMAVGRHIIYTLGDPKQEFPAPTRARSMSPAHSTSTLSSYYEGTEVPPVPEIPADLRNSVSPVVPLQPGQRSLFTPGAAEIRSSWRTSTSASSIGGSSTYTRFSNGSERSFATTNTSVSGASWRKKQKPLPGNIKHMDGIPWELDELPRQNFSRPKDHVFSQAPGKRRHPIGLVNLDPINESGRPSSSKDRPSSSKDRPPRSPVPPRSPTSSTFDQQQAGFTIGKGGPGLTIDSTLGAEVAAVDQSSGIGKPPKTPTRKFWDWRSK